MHLRPSLFFLKSAPGGILSSADKWTGNTTRTIELFNLKVRTMVQTRQAVAACANFEALSSRTN